MGKRSDFERIPRDFYPTPESAVIPLVPHLADYRDYTEPCAGNRDLINHLSKLTPLKCRAAFDIVSAAQWVRTADARFYKYVIPEEGFCFITNPPWSREVLHSIILNLSRQAPTWLLFDADWMHTRQSAPFIPFLRKIVSVGRVKWIPDSPFTGKDNCCWYLFDQTSETPAQFIGRAA